MPIDETPPLTLAPLWRGSVRRWECDENDHLNVRYHFAAAREALAFDFATAQVPSIPAIRRIHARFLAEARIATPLVARGGRFRGDEGQARAYVELANPGDETVHSAFTFELDAPAGDAAPAEIPTHGARRGLATPMRTHDLPCLADAEALPTVEIGRGVLDGTDAPDGTAVPDAFVGRISDGILGLIGWIHGGAAVADRQHGRIGGAVVEYELLFPRPAPIGTPFVVRSGIAALEGRIQRFCHGVFDARSGALLCASNAIAVALDLETRRAATFSDAQRSAIEARCAPELIL